MTGKSHRGKWFTPEHRHETFREIEDKKRWSFHSLQAVLNIAGTKLVYVALGLCMIYNSGQVTLKNPDNQSCIFDPFL
jgi:hypothetical protein